MFWGLIMESQKRYSQTVRKAFHLSMATLDITHTDGQPAQVLCGYDGKNYLLCTLQKSNQIQCNLDLYFEEGHTVSFASNGNSLVHLTGYLTKDLLDEEDSDEEPEFDVMAKKKQRTDDNKVGPSSKKLKLDYLISECEEEEAEDSDFNIEHLVEEELSEEDSDEEEEDAEDVEEEDDESVEGESDDVEEEEEVEEKEEVEEEKVVQNGLSKKSKKAKKEEVQTTPTKKVKQEKPHQLTPGPKTNQQDKTNGVEKKVKSKEEKNVKEPQLPQKKTLSNGVIIEDLKIGQGEAASNGNFVQVYYEGRLKKNNKVFDKTKNGAGFGFRLGRGEVIKGWDIGVAGMKPGGKRRIICPPQVGYGNKGSPPVIPPNSTLIFEVEVKKVKK